MELPTERPASVPARAAARRVVLGFGVREIGVATVALAILTAAALWLRHDAARGSAEARILRTQLALREDATNYYRERFAALEAQARELRLWAEGQTTEPRRTWARERLRRFEAFVARMNQDAEARTFMAAKREVEQLLAAGQLAEADSRLERLPTVGFPGPSELERRLHDDYEAPLAQFSRQSPEFYRALRQYEPDIARGDEAALRAEITSADIGSVTPQLMMKVDLLAAVAAADDPLVADWSALTSAMDYFENPDAATLSAWRRAQRAQREQKWNEAAAALQTIAKSTVRTRQPFRAVLGRALLRSRPGQPAEAYPLLVEAAQAGDKEARRWVAQRDIQEQRYAQAQRWLEDAVAEGEKDAVAPLLAVYAAVPVASREDADRRIRVLERISDRGDAPAEAMLQLGRLYEQSDPPGSKAKGYAWYRRAAEKGSISAAAEVARCALRGIGTAPDLDQAREAASEAFSAGQREAMAPLLGELLTRNPERTAATLQKLIGETTIATPAPYTENREVDGPGVTQLKGQFARYLDKVGMYGPAARLYAAVRDPAAAHRHAELTAGHACETCGGKGKVQASVPCPTCGGKGKQICSFCGGSGTAFVPGIPPCTTCGGSGTMMLDRRVVGCSACGGTGKGKGNVIKQDCTHCEHGYIRCTECTGGMLRITKECPECRGRGTWSLVDRGTE